MKIITNLKGILFILVAVFCYANQGVAFYQIAFITGLAMVINGLLGSFVYRNVLNRMVHSHHIMTESIIMFVLGLCVLLNRVDTESQVPVFFGVWVMVTGINRMVVARHMDRALSTSKYTMQLGILSAIIGGYSMFNSLIFNINTISIVALGFLLQGINEICTASDIPARRKRNKKAHVNLHIRKQRQKGVTTDTIELDAEAMAAAIAATVIDFSAPLEDNVAVIPTEVESSEPTSLQEGIANVLESDIEVTEKEKWEAISDLAGTMVLPEEFKAALEDAIAEAEVASEAETTEEAEAEIAIEVEEAKDETASEAEEAEAETVIETAEMEEADAAKALEAEPEAPVEEAISTDDETEEPAPADYEAAGEIEAVTTEEEEKEISIEIDEVISEASADEESLNENENGREEESKTEYPEQSWRSPEPSEREGSKTNKYYDNDDLTGVEYRDFVWPKDL